MPDTSIRPTRPGAPAPETRPARVRRRSVLGGALGGAFLLGASACVGGSGSGGGTTAPEEPRVVALGQGADADALLALGVVPVAMSAGFQRPIYPWTEEALAGRPVELLTTNETVPIEKVAALRPTLIAATTYYQLDPVRPQLESIAPVLGPGGGVDEETWQQTTLRIGEAVGRAEDARAAIAGAEAVVAAVRDAHPQWQGRTFTFGPIIPGSDLYTVNSTSDASAALLTALGLQLAPAVASLPDSEIPGRALISPENMSLLEADALLLAHFGTDATRREFEQQEVFRRLDAVRRGSYVPIDPDLAIALAFPSVLNIPYAVQGITEKLNAALEPA